MAAEQDEKMWAVSTYGWFLCERSSLLMLISAPFKTPEGKGSADDDPWRDDMNTGWNMLNFVTKAAKIITHRPLKSKDGKAEDNRELLFQTISQFLTEAIAVLSSRPNSMEEIAKANQKHTEFAKTNREVSQKLAFFPEGFVEKQNVFFHKPFQQSK